MFLDSAYLLSMKESTSEVRTLIGLENFLILHERKTLETKNIKW